MGKSSHVALRAVMMSCSVEPSVSCTVHVSGAGPVSYSLNSLQSVSSLAVADVPASSGSRTTHNINELGDVGLKKLFLSRVEAIDISSAFAVIFARCISVTTSDCEK